LFESLKRHLIFYTGEIYSQPFGEGTKTYSFEDAVHMLYDLEPYSKYEELRDPLELITQKPNKGQVIKSEILNIVAPHAMKGETFQNVGDMFTYCLSSNSAKIDGELKYKANRCQLKFKMRPIATFHKLPGFPRISGYKQVIALAPSILLTNTQMKHIIDRAEATYSEIAEVNKVAIGNRIPSTHNLLKFKLNIKMDKSATLMERMRLSNSIMTVIEQEPSHIYFDDEKEFAEFRSKLMVIDMCNVSASIICFSLGAFMLMTTISANIKDSMWDLGVLRSMGSTKEQITKIL